MYPRVYPQVLTFFFGRPTSSNLIDKNIRTIRSNVVIWIRPPPALLICVDFAIFSMKNKIKGMYLKIPYFDIFNISILISILVFEVLT